VVATEAAVRVGGLHSAKWPSGQISNFTAAGKYTKAWYPKDMHYLSRMAPFPGDGSVAAVGHNLDGSWRPTGMIVARMSASGTQQLYAKLTKPKAGGEAWARGLLAQANGRIVVVGYTKKSDGKLVVMHAATAKSNAFTWHRTGTREGVLTGVVPQVGGGYLLTGSGGGKLLAYRVDNDGKELSEAIGKAVGYSIIDAAGAGGAGALLAGMHTDALAKSGVLMRVDAKAKVLWQRKFAIKNAIVQAAGSDPLVELAAGGYGFLMQVAVGGKIRPMIARVGIAGFGDCKEANKCALLAEKDCDDSKACTADYCDPAKGCQHDAAACD